MTVALTADRAELLVSRLAALRGERTDVLGENLLAANGDLADRATNVEASIRMQLIDERIATLELEIEDSRHRRHHEGVVSVGEVVTLDLGEGPETYLFDSVEHAAAGTDVVTPTSPLGRAILGATVGSKLTYAPRRGLVRSVTILDSGQLGRASA
jgi:transcription elongation factor GreA